MKQVALLMFLATGPVWAADGPEVSVWIDERVKLDSFLRRTFLAEIARGTPGFATSVRFSSDGPRPKGHVVVIILKTTPPPRYPLALGLAWTAGDRILPEIEIFLKPVTKLLPPNSPPGDLGRALGRVVAHELMHYTSQKSAHDAVGLFSESMGFDDLAGPPEP